MKCTAYVPVIFAAGCFMAAPALADTVTLSLGLGLASYGGEVELTGGGIARTKDTARLVPSLTLGYDLGETANGWSRSIEGNLHWIDDEISFAHGTLGAVNYEVNYAGHLVGKFGKTVGQTRYFGMAGLGFTDANLATQGNAVGRSTHAGITLGGGLERTFDNGWTGAVSVTSTAYDTFTPDGGGGKAAIGNSLIGFSMSRKF